MQPPSTRRAQQSPGPRATPLPTSTWWEARNTAGSRHLNCLVVETCSQPEQQTRQVHATPLHTRCLHNPQRVPTSDGRRDACVQCDGHGGAGHCGPQRFRDGHLCGERGRQIPADRARGMACCVLDERSTSGCTIGGAPPTHLRCLRYRPIFHAPPVPPQVLPAAPPVCPPINASVSPSSVSSIRGPLTCRARQVGRPARPADRVLPPPDTARGRRMTACSCTCCAHRRYIAVATTPHPKRLPSHLPLAAPLAAAPQDLLMGRSDPPGSRNPIGPYIATLAPLKDPQGFDAVLAVDDVFTNREPAVCTCRAPQNCSCLPGASPVLGRRLWRCPHGPASCRLCVRVISPDCVPKAAEPSDAAPGP